MMDNGIRIDLNAVRLQQAVLCAGCDVISDSPHDSCLVCGSRSLLPLSRVLGNMALAPAPPPTRKQVPETADRVLVLVAPIVHRHRQRVRPGK
ncbi:MAG TPA: hypothetical protein VFU76_18330 [Terriglobales bacterium]|nr:hypothetical protein [Terriglobales bacterium]